MQQRTSRYYTPADVPWLQARLACPAPWPRYVIPGSHLYDNGVWTQSVPPFPFPRTPWPYETETRAAGTGLLWGCPTGPLPTAQQTARAAVQAPRHYRFRR